MKAVYKFFEERRIRLGYMLSLIFFVLLLPACKQERKLIGIEWDGEQAKGIIIPLQLLDNKDSATQLLSVQLEKAATAMFGDYNVQDDYVLFQPLVPLTRGFNYEIFFRKKLVGTIQVPKPDTAQSPTLVAIHPSADTLPENLLKIYLQFSVPMQEGDALQHLALINERGDTLPDVFLNLQQELWNKERTVLTLWLDPGRIKRDLKPNRELGNPLQKGHSYTLAVANRWKDVHGLPLQKRYTKRIYVGERDDVMPRLQDWKINIPEPGSKQALLIRLNEALDYFLLQETFTLIDGRNNKVNGFFKVNDDGRNIQFIPDSRWLPGRYRLRVASYLEDLSGNNLVRPFDRDITRQVKKEEVFLEKEFVIRN